MHNPPLQPNFKLGPLLLRWEAAVLQVAVDLSDSRRRRSAQAESSRKCRGFPRNSVYFKTVKTGIGCTDKMHLPASAYSWPEISGFESFQPVRFGGGILRPAGCFGALHPHSLSADSARSAEKLIKKYFFEYFAP
ncbi:hypothetical protein BEN74_13455 [Acinetobacter sp. WCHAc010034]|nr:hypothetical protein BEN74_13455 [Acinetobacter sp. WCHAc010034]